jgi:hypothetical protein
MVHFAVVRLIEEQRTVKIISYCQKTKTNVFNRYASEEKFIKHRMLLILQVAACGFSSVTQYNS